MPAPDCPTRAELDSFQAGELNDVALTSVASHVESCLKCQRSLETIIGDSSDTVLAALLAEAAANPFAEEVACRHVIDQVSSMVESEGLVGKESAPTIVLDSPRSPAGEPTLPLETIREYKLLAKLGEGGMGAVYKALHTRLDKAVALKVLPEGRIRDAGSVARFQREMKAVGRLDHPNIVRAMDAGEEGGTHFLVMEYVEGADLSELAKNIGPLPVADACELVRQAAVGLQEAHEHGMVHRDIKPSNLILAKSPRKKSPPTLKILDLGLALLSEGLAPDQGLTSTGAMMGTIDYMAPEQGSDTHNVDIRADIYSLGATLYRLLTGSAPFSGEKFVTPVKKILALATKEPAAVQTLRADVPPALAAIVHKMLAKDPAQRFATPEELAEALAPFCQGANLAVLLEHGNQPPSKVGGDAPTHPQLSSPSVATAPTSLPPLPLGEGRGEGVKVMSHKSAPKPRLAGLGNKIPRSLAIAAACGGAALALLLGVVFYLETLKGTIRIEINDPDIKVALDEKGATFQGVDKKHSVRVQPGFHGLTVTRGDLKFDTDKFELRKGETLRLSVMLLAGKVEVVDVARKKSLGSGEIRQPNKGVNLAGNALDFDGQDDYVSLPHVPYDFRSPLTFEAWVTPADNQEKVDEKQGQCLWGRPGCYVGLSHLGWSFYCTKRSLIHGIGEAGKRYHLVAQWDGQRCTLFVNGQPGSKENAEDFDPAAILPRILGANGDWEGDLKGSHFHGRIEEVRISSVPRYKEEFTPPDPSVPFSADPQTLALYHFDEGVGSELKDSSGHGRHGKISGATWVRSGSESTNNVAGWHGWPKDAPAPAIAPFGTKQARKYQEEWAAYLGVKVEEPNSIGMKFRVIPPGEFLMGTSDEEIAKLQKEAEKLKLPDWSAGPIPSEGPQHRVMLSKPYGMSVHEVTRGEFRQFVEATGYKTDAEKDGQGGYGWKDGKVVQAPEFLWNTHFGFSSEQTDEHPVVQVSWNDAIAFCDWLSRKEGLSYRLPTESQWEFACRAGSLAWFCFGDNPALLQRYGWYANQGGRNTKAVGQKEANAFGLFDMHGNAREWCHDWHGPYKPLPVVDPLGPADGSDRVGRGGVYAFVAIDARSAYRFSSLPDYRDSGSGFRVVRTFEKPYPRHSTEAVKAIATVKSEPRGDSADWHGWPKDAPKPAIAPFDAKQARKHQEEWANYLGVPLEYENSLRMKFVLIPPGEFLMGSPAAEVDELVKAWDPNDKRGPVCLKSATPQHRVILTRPMYASIHEVTQKSYQAVMGNNPSVFAKTGESKELVEKVAGMDTADFAVDSVSWLDATDFCSELSRREKLQACYSRVENKVTLREANGYRLPSEAEWEFTCRAGSTTSYWFGDGNEGLPTAGWFAGNSGGRRHAVGELQANPFGLYDLHGNAWEWVQDWWEPSYPESMKGAVNPRNESLTGKSERVLRGGNWRGIASLCRSSLRDARDFWHRHQDYGFRVWLSVDAVKASMAPVSHDREANGTVFPAYSTAPLHLVKQKDDYVDVRAELELLRKSSKQNYHIVILPTLGDYLPRPADYLRMLAEEWEHQAAQQKQPFDAERLVIILMAMNDQQLQIHFGPQLKDGLGLDGPPVTKELLVPHFLPFAKQGKLSDGLVSLLPGTEKWIAERDAAKNDKPK